ncbi:MAG: biotin carboxylase N-terminal domain-containing protein [Silicimonas sp.]
MHRVLIANRGEIACRIIRAAKAVGVETVAVYSEADADLPHVALADKAVLVGPANARNSYLDMDKLLSVAAETGSTMIHPGYGFLSENADFARRVQANGLVFVGPAPDHIELMGDKQNARAAAIEAEVPVLPGTHRLTGDETIWKTEARRIGYPLLVKAVAGGGGHGMKLIDSEEKLLPVIQQTSEFAARIFGDGGVYLERCLLEARHVEVQVFGFGAAGAVHLFERDCSLQRRHQKVIEEAPAPALTETVRAEMTEAALRLVRSIDYVGAGTVEYLYDPATEEFYFLEMNTRIQVEHPVSEMITGIDLVTWQLRCAMSDEPVVLVPQKDIAMTGAAVEARLYAENPSKNFLPVPGEIMRLTLPDLPGIRWESGYRSGNSVTVHYDPLILKVIAHGPNRKDALQRLSHALRSMEIEAEGTNLGFLLDLLDTPQVQDGRIDTGFIERAFMA